MAKIVELRVENFRRIKAVEIRPDGSLVVVSGKNGAGKTSVLHAIWAVMKGRSVAGPTPIRKGAEQCTIRAKTEEFTVTRTFKTTKDGELTTDVKIVMADGRKIGGKQQAMLDALLPDLALDPLDFMRRPAKDQIDTIKGLVKGFDFAKNAAARKEAYDQRTTANRRRDESVAAADAVVLPAGPEPAAIDTAELMDAMQAGARHNADLETRRARRAAARADSDRKMDEAEQLRARAATLEREAKEIDHKLDTAEALPEPVDIAAQRDTLAQAERVRDVREAFARRRTHEQAATTAAEAADRLTAQIAALDEAKRKAIADAELPVAGLEFDEERVLLNGLPFELASLAEKLSASVAIGMALCPPPEDPALRIMTVDEGSELDSHSLALLDTLASSHNYQIWLAKVSDESEEGFLIIDGAAQQVS